MVDRFLYTSMRYPGNYGFIPHTLSDDGDPCDVIVANTRAIIPGAVMRCRIVGVLLMEDEAGGDEKLLAVPAAKLTQRYAKVENYTDLPEITLKQIEHFFAHYKDLEPNKWVKIVALGRRRGGAAARRSRASSAPRRPRRSAMSASRAAAMKRSFIDARIEAMLGDVRAPRRAGCRRSRSGARSDYRADPAAARRIAERGLGWNVVEFKPGGFATRGPQRVHAADGRLAQSGRRAAAGSMRRRRCWPRTASARRITITSSRPRTSSTAAARASSSNCSRSIARGAPLKERFRVVKDVKTLDLGAGRSRQARAGREPDARALRRACVLGRGRRDARRRSVARQRRRHRQLLPAAAPAPAPIEEDRPKRYVTVRDHARLGGVAS